MTKFVGDNKNKAKEVGTTDDWPFLQILKYVFLTKPKNFPKAGKKEIGVRTFIGMACVLVAITGYYLVKPAIPSCGDKATFKSLDRILLREIGANIFKDLSDPEFSRWVEKNSQLTFLMPTILSEE